uniref:Cell adhesion molecule 4 n=1 Tax=Xenopus tropicalis TaxID=8364 RepID=A0A803KFF0_XENTR
MGAGRQQPRFGACVFPVYFLRITITKYIFNCLSLSQRLLVHAERRASTVHFLFLYLLHVSSTLRSEHGQGENNTQAVVSQEVQAENVTVVEGGTAEISCHLHQYDGSIVVIQNPVRQTLFFNGTRALKDTRFQLVEFTQKVVKIHLSDAKLEDEGGYFCQLYTEDTHHQIATLTVIVPPDNPLVEVKEQAVEGGEIELTCISPRTRPAATLRWYRDRKELKGFTSKQENGKTFSITNSIRFSVDRKDDRDIVTCEASHPALKGQKKQTQYELDVQFSPTANIQPSQSLVREGDELNLKCEVTGNPRFSASSARRHKPHRRPGDVQAEHKMSFNTTCTHHISPAAAATETEQTQPPGAGQAATMHPNQGGTLEKPQTALWGPSFQYFSCTSHLTIGGREMKVSWNRPAWPVLLDLISALLHLHIPTC